MEILKNISLEEVETALKRPGIENDYLTGAVNNILQRVKTSGDAAIKELTLQFDKIKLDELRVTDAEIKEAISKVDPELQTAIEVAKNNISRFHQLQRRESLDIETMPGVRCTRKSMPIQKVGLYIPGGTAPLFSTVLMLGVPATLAGCSEIVLVSPPNKSGEIHPAILFAANLVGINSIYKIGGAQAIAALAYGTESITKVDKIFGPGNQYVTKAKQLVNLNGTAIDMPAGPSEVAVIADETADPDFIAADLLSQAEHGEDSQVVLLTDSQALIDATLTSIEKQIEDLPRKEVARKCLLQSRAVLSESIEDSVAISNAYAPEHLIINCKDSDKVAEQIVNAGSVFVGSYTPESAGDYASGTNHTLPTNAAARAYSGVSLDSFTKEITYQYINETGIQNLGPTIELMAEAEELIAHKNAVSIRLEKLKAQ